MRLYGWLGLLLLAISEYGLINKIEPFPTWFYCFAWWSYILVADNLLLKLTGKSLLTEKRRELPQMLFLSVFIWLLFEAYNFRINNWSYRIPPMETWTRWVAYSASFATVLPGIFITSDIVSLLLKKSSEPASPQYGRLISPSFSIALGAALSTAPFIWPRYFFFSVWLGPIFLLDPLLGKLGIQSFSLEAASATRKRFWSLMLGGLLCGLMWEFWNFWAGSKWIYTVPFFGEWKLFEMPALGFLGFPPFAVECWILYHLLKAVPGHMDSRPARVAWWLGLAILMIFLFRGIDSNTVVQFAGELS
jgi:hypothetical protein